MLVNERKCYDALPRSRNRLELRPTQRTFHQLWHGGSKSALFAISNTDYSPEVRYELYCVAGLECPSYQDVESLAVICPICGERMKRVTVPTLSNVAIRDFGEYRCPKCFDRAWAAERERRQAELARREAQETA